MTSLEVLGIVLASALGLPVQGGASSTQPPPGRLTPAVSPGFARYDPRTGQSQAQVGPSMPGPDIVFSSSCNPSWSLVGEGPFAILDTGRIPSPTSPTNLPHSMPGCAASYVISGFEIGYCTDQPSLSFTMHFYDNALSCTDPSTLTPTKTVALSNLPGAPVGSWACWFVTVDLDSSGDTFVLQADGDGTYSNGVSDSFGWWMGPFGTTSTNEGPMASLRGGCEVYGVNGTVWDPNGQDFYPRAKGIGTLPALWWDQQLPPTYPGCWIADNAGTYLRLFSRACPLFGPGVGFCSGDGSATPCPCGNDGQGYHGCGNSAVPHGARLEATGAASLGADDVVLRASRMPATAPALFFQGTLQQNGGFGAVFGDGLRCAGGEVLRLGTIAASNGAAQWPQAGGAPLSQQGQVGQPGTRTYQVWYRNVATFCTPDGFNLSNGYEIEWQG